MSQLQDNLNEILRQKNVYLLPANLRAGVTLLGVEGTYGGTHDTVKLFPSVAAMNADTDKVLGDIAIVYNTNNTTPRPLQVNDIFHKLYIPNSITFTSVPNWIQEFMDDETVTVGTDINRVCGFWIVDSSAQKTGLDGDVGDWYPGADCSIYVTKEQDSGSIYYDMMLDFQSMEDGVTHYDLRSSDGLTWTHSGDPLTWDTKTNKGVLVKIGRSEGWGTDHRDAFADVAPFLQIIPDTIIGMYEVRNYRTAYNSETGQYTTELRYCPLETQLTPITASEVYENKVVMGNNNTIVTGTVTLNQTEINTAVDTTESILGPEVEPSGGNQNDPGEGNLEEGNLED